MNSMPAQVANMRMTPGMPAGNMMNMPGANGLMGGVAGGMMRPPVLPRANQTQLPGGGVGVDMGVPGMNGMPGSMGVNGMQGMARQPSVGDLRANNAPQASLPGATNAAGLSINTNINPGLNAQLPMAGTPNVPVPPLNPMATPTPTGTVSPNPAMLVDPTLPAPPATPRQVSQPPMSGSPFPGGMVGGMPGSAERKMAGGPGALANAPPLSRASTGDVFTAPPAAPPAAGPGPAAAANQPAPQIVAQLPPLPANVNLNPKVTRVSVVPLVDSEAAIPPLKTEEIAMVKEWMKADKEYEGRYKKMRERMADEVREVVVKRRAWYEKDPLDDPRVSRRRKEKFELIGLKSGKEERTRKKVGRREGFKL